MKSRYGVAAVGMFVLAGCAGGGGLGDILGGVLGGGQPTGSGAQSGAVTAEVQQVDSRNQVLEVRTEDGQNVDIRFDNDTRVVYQQREYPVTALEPGDVVRMNVTRNNRNEYYTAEIQVQQSVQDRQGNTGGTMDPERLYQLSGTVDSVDPSNGLFTIRLENGRLYSVAMPYNANTTTRDRFGRLRRGNTIRFEGRYVSDDRIELARFL